MESGVKHIADSDGMLAFSDGNGLEWKNQSI
jgi:hypothetical protein